MAEDQKQEQKQQTPTPLTNKTAEQIRADIMAEIDAQRQSAERAKLKEMTGHDTWEAFASAKKAAEEKRLAEQGEFAKLAEQRAQEAQKWQAKFQDSVIRQAVLGACLKHNAVDGDVVLALVRGDVQVDENGAVSISGKAAEDAITALLKSKPYLVKLERSGSGSPSYPDPAAERDKANKEALEAAQKSGNPMAVLQLLRPVTKA